MKPTHQIESESDEKRALLNRAIEILLEQGLEGLGEVLEGFLNHAMVVERENFLQAKSYERIKTRKGYANGYKSKGLNSRIGKLSLKIPQVRESDEGYYPSFLEKGLRSEQALLVSMSEMYLQGVSTRKVRHVLEELCGLEVSSSQVSRAAQLLDDGMAKWRNRDLGETPYVYLDARYEKVRQEGRVVDCAVLLAIGVDSKGYRRVLGYSCATSEAEIHWRGFLETLHKRGLCGLKMITSDSHSGLKAALRSIWPGVSWQRCQFHLQQNAQSYATRHEKRVEIGRDLRRVFNSETKQEAKEKLEKVIRESEKTNPKYSQWLESNVEEGLSVLEMPVEHQKRLRTNNPLERLNREIKRRSRVVGIFPNIQSAERLIGALLIEQDEQWQTQSKKYLTF